METMQNNVSKGVSRMSSREAEMSYINDSTKKIDP
jgi:hypothetical protein